MAENEYANAPNMSRSEEIIQSILDNTEYDEAARSRIEYLLIELKNAIAAGGGGGSVTSYAPLTEKPKIDNYTLQAGNNSSSDLGLQTKLTFDATPTENSTNPVTSGGVYTALGAKANSADVYNKSAVDTALTAKADKSTTYTKTEVDTALSSKQNVITDLADIRSGATLGSTAVQPVSGKGLSTNDYTTTEKNKLAGIEAQANKTTVDSVLSETSTNPVQNKVVKSALDGKQDVLSTAQLSAINSGITAERLAQDENNILLNTKYGVSNHFKVTLDDIKRRNTNGYTWNDNVATHDSTGITFTVNSDMTITVNGTSSSSTVVFSVGMISPSYNGFMFSCSPSEASISTYRSGVNYVGYDTGNGLLLTNTIDRLAQIEILSNQSVSDVVFKPMIIDKAFWDSGIRNYEPYAMNNAELTSENEINKNNISKYVYETVTVNLASQDISWTAYGSVYASSVIGLTQVGTVLSFVLIDWTGIRDTDLTLIPYQSSSAGNGFKMLSSTNTFLQSNSKVVYRVFGIKQST